MAGDPKDQTERTEAETEKQRDEVLRRMLNTPPKPHSNKGQRNGNSESDGSSRRKSPSPKRED